MIDAPSTRPSPGGRRSSRSMTPRVPMTGVGSMSTRSEEHTSELQSLRHLVCRLLLEKKKRQEDKVTQAGDYSFFVGWRSDTFFYDTGPLNNFKSIDKACCADRDSDRDERYELYQTLS